jgi:hypothetical protein
MPKRRSSIEIVAISWSAGSAGSAAAGAMKSAALSETATACRVLSADRSPGGRIRSLPPKPQGTAVGLPLAPFRTDDFPGVTAGAH